MNSETQHKTGRITKDESRLVNVWIPTAWLPMISRAVRRLDTDRSKLIRTAVREKLERAGFQCDEHAVN